jgi:hypothetical protein
MSVRFPVEAIYISSPKSADRLWGPVLWLPGAFSSGVIRPGREADQCPPSSAEVKNILM